MMLLMTEEKENSEKLLKKNRLLSRKRYFEEKVDHFKIYFYIYTDLVQKQRISSYIRPFLHSHMEAKHRKIPAKYKECKWII